MKRYIYSKLIFKRRLCRFFTLYTRMWLLRVLGCSTELPTLLQQLISFSISRLPPTYYTVKVPCVVSGRNRGTVSGPYLSRFALRQDYNSGVVSGIRRNSW